MVLKIQKKKKKTQKIIVSLIIMFYGKLEKIKKMWESSKLPFT